MRHTSAITVLILSLTMWLLGMPLDSHAKPKSRSFGCTVSDLQTNFASSCIHQADQDIMQGHSYIHVVVCEGGQQKCCTVSDSGQILNCRRPAGSALMQGTLNQAPVLSRGTEGADETDESTPIPSWLTKEWIEEHDGKEPAE
ncbi:hypothetical protein YTPLAS18_07500 [Nitrospira sp.]|nr:hypothetical protein YTPLAS18_07500 [Nitrospira sp.]